VVALGTGQRNLAAAFVVGTSSFDDRPDVLAGLATAGLLGMITVIPLAMAMGKLVRTQEEQAAPATEHPEPSRARMAPSPEQRRQQLRGARLRHAHRRK